MWIATLLLSSIFSLSFSGASPETISRRQLFDNTIASFLSEASNELDLENAALVEFIQLMLETLYLTAWHEKEYSLLYAIHFKPFGDIGVDDDDDDLDDESIRRMAEIIENMYEGIVDATGDGFPWSGEPIGSTSYLFGILNDAIDTIDDEDDRALIRLMVDALTADPSNTALQSGFMAVLNRIVDRAGDRDAAVQDVREHLKDVFIDAWDVSDSHGDDDDDDDDEDSDDDDDNGDNDEDDDDDDGDDDDDDEGDSAEILTKSKLESGGLNRAESGSGLSDAERGAVDLSTSSLINIWLSMAIFMFINVTLFWCFVKKYSDKKQMVRFTSRDQTDIDI